MCVALYEYKDMEHSSEAWCAPGFRVDVLELTNEDWHKVLLYRNCDNFCFHSHVSFYSRFNIIIVLLEILTGSVVVKLYGT